LSIGVLDIAGFEIFGACLNSPSCAWVLNVPVENSYEQLLINFTNEKLVSSSLYVQLAADP
jgi:myosin heavy subunit